MMAVAAALSNMTAVSIIMSSISCQERIWTMKQIIRNAPEFGVCRNLGANIFNYFVLHDFNDVDAMTCILLDEIIDTPLQYLFEYAISLAIAAYQNREGANPLLLNNARLYKPKLLRKD